MLRHLVLIKFKANAWSDSDLRHLSSIVEAMENEMCDVTTATLTSNVIDRAGNYDLMLTVDMKEAYFKQYLSHPVHLQFAAYIKDKIENKIKFDFYL